MLRNPKVGDYVEISSPGSFPLRGRITRVGETERDLEVESPAIYGPYWGNAFGYKGLKKVKNAGPSNDAIPEDEMVLAELLQNAGARGLQSTTGRLFDAAYPDAMLDSSMPGCSYAVGMFEPPAGATRCCAIGAQTLSPPVSSPINSFGGNDAADDRGPAVGTTGKNLRDWNIGAAFEQALRPE